MKRSEKEGERELTQTYDNEKALLGLRSFSLFGHAFYQLVTP
jgi:hypothetical protein